MWNYEKRLQFPVNIKEPNAKLAQFIISQYGGPDGELGASMRYLSQRYTMPYREVAGLLTDIATEESVHKSYPLLSEKIRGKRCRVKLALSPSPFRFRSVLLYSTFSSSSFRQAFFSSTSSSS